MKISLPKKSTVLFYCTTHFVLFGRKIVRFTITLFQIRFIILLIIIQVRLKKEVDVKYHSKSKSEEMLDHNVAVQSSESPVLNAMIPEQRTPTEHSYNKILDSDINKKNRSH